MKALQDTRVPVPRVHALCEDEKVLGQSFYVMDFCEGRVLDQEEVMALSPRERHAVYDDMNRILAEMHTLDHIALGLEKHGKRGNYAKRQLRTWSRQFRLGVPAIKKHMGEHESTENVLEASEPMERLIAQLEAMAGSVVSDESCLVHGDFRPGNIILHPTEPSVHAVIDWEISTLGHPIADLAYLMLPWYGPRRFNAQDGTRSSDGNGLPEGIVPEMEYLRQYCERSGRSNLVSQREWKFWKALTLFRIACISHGVYARGLAGNAGSDKALVHGDYFPACLRCARGPRI